MAIDGEMVSIREMMFVRYIRQADGQASLGYFDREYKGEHAMQIILSLHHNPD